METVFIGLGSNLGNRKDAIKSALNEIAILPHSTLLGVSSLYETSPLSTIAQGPFLNAVCSVHSSLSPLSLLNELQRIEKLLGKRVVAKNGPRVIDLDLLFFGSRVLEDPLLILPHPRLSSRLFVLIPLLELIEPLPPSCYSPSSNLGGPKGVDLLNPRCLQQQIAYLKESTDQVVNLYSSSKYKEKAL